MEEDNDSPPFKRIKLSFDEVQNLSKEEILEKWQEQEALIDALMSKNRPAEDEEISSLRESEEKLKTQQTEASRRENVLVMRLAAKEQEMQEYVTQIQELKQAQNTSAAQLRSMVLDPAINIMFQRMKKEMDGSKEKLEQAQNDLAAWKFTPDSQTGKRLMAKCRMLLQENEELGKVISSGRTAKLEGEVALEKTLVQEMKKSQAEMDEFLLELDEDVEGMQSTIYLLQQQLKEAKDQMNELQDENIRLGGRGLEIPIDAGVSVKIEPISSRSLHNALDARGEHDGRDRTRLADENFAPSDKAGYQRTSRQSSNSPSVEVVSNHNRDHQVSSKQEHLHTQTTRPTTTNGGHEHGGYEAMDTSEDGFHRASCDADSTTGDHNNSHSRHFKGYPESETTNDGSSTRGSNVEVNNHHQGDANSDVSFIITENTDAASSCEAWSPSSRHLKQSDDVDMADDAKIKYEKRGRTVGGMHVRGSDDDHQTLLQNGLVDSAPQFDLKDDVVV